MEFTINKKMLKEAAGETKGITEYTPGYIEIIYNMMTGEIWAHYHPDYNSYTRTDDNEIKATIKKEYNEEELELLIKNEIELLQRAFRKLENKKFLPKTWIENINSIELKKKENKRKFHINKELLKKAAKETEKIKNKGYAEIIYNMIDGAVWAYYQTSYKDYTEFEYETEFKFIVRKEYKPIELEARIKNKIREIQKNLKEPGTKEKLPERWVYLINNIKL